MVKRIDALEFVTHHTTECLLHSTRALTERIDDLEKKQEADTKRILEHRDELDQHSGRCKKLELATVVQAAKVGELIDTTHNLVNQFQLLREQFNDNHARRLKEQGEAIAALKIRLEHHEM